MTKLSQTYNGSRTRCLKLTMDYEQDITNLQWAKNKTSQIYNRSRQKYQIYNGPSYHKFTMDQDQDNVNLNRPRLFTFTMIQADTTSQMTKLKMPQIYTGSRPCYLKFPVGQDQDIKSYNRARSRNYQLTMNQDQDSINSQ